MHSIQEPCNKIEIPGRLPTESGTRFEKMACFPPIMSALIVVRMVNSSEKRIPFVPYTMQGIFMPFHSIGLLR